MFIEASAIVAIFTAAPSSTVLLAALEAARGKVFCSPLARFEAIRSLSSQAMMVQGEDAEADEVYVEVEDLVDAFLTEVGAKDIMISAGIGRAACEAAARYGVGSDHPAQLSMGQCFAYACAKAYHVQLLNADNRFALTDIG